MADESSAPTAAAPKILNLKPGLYENVPEDVYHEDRVCTEPTLSQSLGKVLIWESPLHGYYAHPRLGLKEIPAIPGEKEEDDSTPAMDYGTLGHAMLLGKGRDIEIGDFKDFRTKDAKKFRDDAKAAGKIPVLRKTYLKAVLMKQTVMQRITDLGFGPQFAEATSEVTAIFDEGEGCRCRARFDKLNRRLWSIYDLKISDNAHPSWCAKQIQNMRYDMQDSAYRTALQRLDPNMAGREKFYFFFIESSFPHCVTPIELNGEFRTNGTAKWNHAVNIWKKCRELNQWPAHTDVLLRVEPKEWALAETFGLELPKFKTHE